MTYASTPKNPEIVCIQVYPLCAGSPSGVTSAITDRVGLKLILIARSSVRATAIATDEQVPEPEPGVDRVDVRQGEEHQRGESRLR